MSTSLILFALAVVFLAAALWRLASDGFKLGHAARTWLLVALIFTAVAGWLWWSGMGTPVMSRSG